MNKDAILASVIGFGIGLMITGAVLVGPNVLPMLKKFSSEIGKGSVQSATTQTSPTPSLSITASNAQPLTVDSPEDQAIVGTETLTVSGKATKGTIVVVAGMVDEAVITASDTNTFSAKVTLKEGINDISVTNIVDPTPSNKHFTIFYTPKS